MTFIHIPAPPTFSNPSFPPYYLSLELSLCSTQDVAVALKSISKTSNIKALVIDFINSNDPKTLTEKPNTDVPTYFYLTSGASALVVMLLFYHGPNQTVAKNKPSEIIQIPGLPTMSIDDLPKEGIDPSSQIFQILLQIANNMKDNVGIIINTFEAIEENAIKMLTDDVSIPPVYCIGPVISSSYGEEDKGCLSWLDSQLSQSVVLLCFGSMGRFSRKQIKEIAIGLEKSEQRFLWVVRTELSESGSDELELSLEELTPEGFLERTKEKVLVVRGWAPQAEILSHDSMGGFVTHCGWNSVLEALCVKEKRMFKTHIAELIYCCV